MTPTLLFWNGPTVGIGVDPYMQFEEITILRQVYTSC